MGRIGGENWIPKWNLILWIFKFSQNWNEKKNWNKGKKKLHTINGNGEINSTYSIHTYVYSMSPANWNECVGCVTCCTLIRWTTDVLHFKQTKCSLKLRSDKSNSWIIVVCCFFFVALDNQENALASCIVWFEAEKNELNILKRGYKLNVSGKLISSNSKQERKIANFTG